MQESGALLNGRLTNDLGLKGRAQGLRDKRAVGWMLLPKRWVVERTVAWPGHDRIHGKDDERLTESSETQVRISMIQFMLRRLKPIPEENHFRRERRRRRRAA